MIFVRTPLRSAIALLFAIVQMAAAGAASIADGKLEAEAVASAAYAHIEAHGTADCPRVHLEACTLCRVVHAGAERPLDAHIAGEARSGAVRRHAHMEDVPSRPGTGPVSLRGPPRVTVPRTTAA